MPAMILNCRLLGMGKGRENLKHHYEKMQWLAKNRLTAEDDWNSNIFIVIIVLKYTI
jgi:hypothetical protein